MKSYTLASERAAAPTGCAYIAPSLVDLWFRWGEGSPVRAPDDWHGSP